MTDFIISLLILSGVMSAVIVLALAFLRSGVKISSSAVYGIWLIIIIRLAFPVYTLPPLFEFDLPVRETHSDVLPGILSTEPPSVQDEYIPLPSYGTPEFITPENTDTSQPSADYSDEITEQPEISRSVGVYDILSAVYLTGTALSVIFAAVSYLTYIRRIKLALALPSEETALIYSSAAEKLGIKRPPMLYLSTIPSSPMLFGFLSPKIVIPDYLTPAEAEYVLIHELIHYKRRDIWIKLFVCAVRAMHWFNPLVYIAYERLNRALEMRCDDCVMSVLKDNRDQHRVEYCSVMLMVIRRSLDVGNELTSNFEPRRSAVSARFANILDSSKKKRGVLPVMLAVILCAAAGSIVGCSEDDPNEITYSDSLSAESNSDNTQKSETEAEQNEYNTELDAMISEIDSSTVTVLNAAAYEKILADGFMELNADDVKHIISSTIDLYFRYENIVLPDIMEFFAQYPTVEKEIYINGEMQKIPIPDTLMTNIYYYLIDGYTVNTIHDINEGDAIIEAYSYPDINGDGEIDEQEKADAPAFYRQGYHTEMLYQIHTIIMYRLIALSDPSSFSESAVSYNYLPGGADKGTFFKLSHKGLADASIIFATAQDSIKLFPTDEIEYENMLLDSLAEAERELQEKYRIAQQHENELNAELDKYLAELRELKAAEEQLKNEMAELKEEQVLLEEMLEEEKTAMMAEAEEKSIASRWNLISGIEQDINEVYAQFTATQDSYFVTQSMISYTEQQISELRQMMSVNNN